LITGETKRVQNDENGQADKLEKEEEREIDGKR